MSYKELKSKLESEIKKASQVFIIGHNYPDFDSIGSAIGLYVLAKSFKKAAYIIVDEDGEKLEPGVKRILDKHKTSVNFIKKEAYEKLANSRSLLILTDVNKKNRVAIGDNLDKIKRVIIIDHHSEDEETVVTDMKYNSLIVSSASEVVSKILSDFKVKYSPDVANSLLAGISLDTKRFKANTSSQTFDIAKKLVANGADIDEVNALFLEEFESFARISNLIINGTVIQKYSEDTLSPIQVSFTINRNMPKTIYNVEDYAKAADRMLKFIGIDAAFTLGYIDEETIHISARGGKKVNVGKIMNEMNGGGNNQCAGGRIVSDDILAVEEKLKEKIIYGLADDEEIAEVPKVIKIKQISRKK